MKKVIPIILAMVILLVAVAVILNSRKDTYVSPYAEDLAELQSYSNTELGITEIIEIEPGNEMIPCIDKSGEHCYLTGASHQNCRAVCMDCPANLSFSGILFA